MGKEEAKTSPALKLALTGALTCLMSAYVIVVRMSKREGDYAYDLKTIILSSELLKIAISAASLRFQMARDPTGDGEGFYRPTRRTVLLFCVPGLLYFVNNQVPFYALLYLSPGPYQVMAQLKVLTTAVAFRTMLQRHLTLTKWGALGILFIGCSVASLKGDVGELFEQPWQGHALVVLQCSISAIAAVFSEYMLKKTGQSIHVQNIQMYSSSVVFALITLSNTGKAPAAWFAGHNAASCAAIVLNSCTGLVTSAIMKYADNIVKTFAVSGSLFLVSGASFFLFDEAIEAQLVVGALLAAVSIYVYSFGADFLWVADTWILGDCGPCFGGGRREGGKRVREASRLQKSMTGAIVGLVFAIVLTMQAFSSGYEAPTAADVPAQVVTLPRAPAPEGEAATGAGARGTDPEPDRPAARPAAPASVGIPPRRYAKPAAGSLAREPGPLGRRVGPGAAAPKAEPAGAKPRIPPRINDAKLVEKVQKTIARPANPAYGATWKGRGGARDCGEYCIIIPTWTGHFPDVTRFMQSVMVHADPADNFGIRLVVGDNKEKAELEKRLAKLKTCGVNWQIDALEAILKSFKISKSATNLFKARGRYHYQSLKKMYAARYYDYRLSMWFDSEGELLKPTSFKKVFEDYMEAPYFWRAELVKGKQRERWANVKRCLDIAGVGLGDVDMSAASMYDFFEHYTWILEKPIVERIFAASEARHKADLVSVWVGHEQRCFEWGMYAMFVYAHRADYPQYRFETIRDVMSRYLPKPFVDAQFRAGRLRMEGVFEKLLSPETYNGFFKLFADYKVWWVRQSEPPLKANSRCQAKNGQKTKGGWCRKCGTKAGLPCYSTFSAKLVAKMVDEHPYLSVTVCNPDMTYHFRKAGKKPAASKTCDKCGKGACQLRRENWQSVVPALYGK